MRIMASLTHHSMPGISKNQQANPSACNTNDKHSAVKHLWEYIRFWIPALRYKSIYRGFRKTASQSKHRQHTDNNITYSWQYVSASMVDLATYTSDCVYRVIHFSIRLCIYAYIARIWLYIHGQMYLLPKGLKRYRVPRRKEQTV